MCTLEIFGLAFCGLGLLSLLRGGATAEISSLIVGVSCVITGGMGAEYVSGNESIGDRIAQLEKQREEAKRVDERLEVEPGTQ